MSTDTIDLAKAFYELSVAKAPEDPGDFNGLLSPNYIEDTGDVSPTQKKWQVTFAEVCVGGSSSSSSSSSSGTVTFKFYYNPNDAKRRIEFTNHCCGLLASVVCTNSHPAFKDKKLCETDAFYAKNMRSAVDNAARDDGVTVLSVPMFMSSLPYTSCNRFFAKVTVEMHHRALVAVEIEVTISADMYSRWVRSMLL
jgi:hypothetical protein